MGKLKMRTIRLNTRIRSLVLGSIFIVLGVAPIAVYAQTSPNAATIESENGTPSGGVTYIDSTLASGGKFARFYQEQSGGSGDSYEDIPSNFTVADYLESRSIPQDMSWEPSGNFRTFCGPSHLEWDDPIVYPGQDGAAHLHQFFGNASVNENSTYQSLRTTGQSTCEGGPLNRTGYWTPAMFDGQGRVIPPDFILVYYKSTNASGVGGNAAAQQSISQTATLPNGLRMIAGSPASGQHRWKCESGNGSSGSTIPNCPDNDKILGEVFFPPCWDGVNLDSPNHRSHMSYKVRDGHTGQEKCPDSHPVHIPEITEIFHYKNLPGENEATEWSISSDMGAAPGSTLHADWFGAWDNGVQERWTQNCLREMRNGNNGDLCDGQGLEWGIRSLMGPGRISGWTPMKQ